MTMDVSSEKNELKEYNGCCSITTFVYSFGPDGV
jgi:hypothetical protein